MDDLTGVKLSVQFLQMLDSLLVDGDDSVLQFISDILSSQRWLSTWDLDTIKTVFQNPHDVNCDHLQLCQRLKELPEQVEKGLATVLERSIDPKIRSMASSILQRNQPLRDSTMKSIYRCLQKDQFQEHILGAIEALHGSEELPNDIWCYFANLLDLHTYFRLPIINAPKNVRSIPSMMLEALARLFEDENEK
ncbi:hypothetical protein ACHAP5_011812, partial [Fusarium lateritium]